MRRLVTLLVIAGTLALAGCATATGDSSPSPVPPGVTLPSIEITRTGGIAGVHETLQVSTDGQWTYTGTTSPTTGYLPATARTRLTEILADPDLPGQIAAAPPDQCCDMFQYELHVGDQTYEFGEPDLGPLLTELLDLLREQTDF